MAKTTTIMLGDVEYVVHKLNVGELEAVMDVLATASPGVVPFKVLRIALRRAEPAVLDASTLEPDPDQVREAVSKILAMSGMGEAAPGEGKPATAA